MKLQVIFYSMYGHIHRMAEAVAEGARSVAGAEVSVFRVPSSCPKRRSRSLARRRAQQGSRTCRSRRSNSCRMRTRSSRHADALRQHMRADAQLPRPGRGGGAEGSLIGKVGAVFTRTATQHGGQESTVLRRTSRWLHQGMVLVGMRTARRARCRWTDPGGSPYGAATIASAVSAAHAERARTRDGEVPGSATSPRSRRAGVRDAGLTVSRSLREDAGRPGGEGRSVPLAVGCGPQTDCTPRRSRAAGCAGRACRIPVTRLHRKFVFTGCREVILVELVASICVWRGKNSWSPLSGRALTRHAVETDSSRWP